MPPSVLDALSKGLRSSTVVRGGASIGEVGLTPRGLRDLGKSALRRVVVGHRTGTFFPTPSADRSTVST